MNLTIQHAVDGPVAVLQCDNEYEAKDLVETFGRNVNLHGRLHDDCQHKWPWLAFTKEE